MNTIEEKRLDTIQRHIKNVQENCEILANKLYERGEKDLARILIANAQIHDNSKLKGIEWKYLHDDVKIDKPELFHAALESHWSNNPHHPEHHPDGIHRMSRVLLAEWVCDVKTRSNEFGTDVRDFIKDTATKRYKFTVQSKIYKEIKELVDLLLDAPFK